MATQDTATEDKIDEQLFNKSIWQSVNGTASKMPEPQHSVIGSGSGSGSSTGSSSQPAAKDPDG